jgi:putative peptide zinc metalloprotease protein
MEHGAPPANELERRKHVKLLLRRDLDIEPQRYEGRVYYVVKDPVGLRYYRLKDNEYFLLKYFDGRHTMEDCQKAYEKHYRPDRLKLEDLEAFGQQLVKAGLAQNDSPKAGKLLFENRNKRLRQEWLQVFTNILYIKIPVFDPDRLLNRMVRPLGWIFSTWFFLLSIGVMLAAALLVATHFETFRNKLPDYQVFFRFSTVARLWVALGLVKVIHEFGHGLSCKRYGGEVHEMGALFLCLSPALYCNVSDAWTLPNKWHRIIISAAGIYVELIIAAIATFVWWNTPAQPFLNNLSMSLMVVCSVSTVVFNANPLMRYDGYYVLADWLEIPNLRERSNRFLKNVMLEHCLGVEVQPEPYMALWRKILFVTYAITSYIYRWVVTFGILWFLYNFLRPYGLEIVSELLALAAVGSQAGWPLYRLGKNIHKRGRLPDMKRWRVTVSCAVLGAVLAFVVLVPVPVSRVRAVGVVESQANAVSRVYPRHKGLLKELRVRPGDHVKKNDVLAVLSDPETEAERKTAELEYQNSREHLYLLQQEYKQNSDAPARAKVVKEMAETKTKRDKAQDKAEMLGRALDELVLRAPRDGVVGTAPRTDEIGKLFDDKEGRPLFTIHDPNHLRVALPLQTSEFNRLRQDLERLSDKALKTKRLLHKDVSLHCKDRPLADVLNDLQGQVRGLHLWLDPAGGVPPGFTVSYETDGRPLSAVLDGLSSKYGLGYVVLSEDGAEHDGWVRVKAGTERGEPMGGRPLNPLDITVRIHGRDAKTWKGRIRTLPESEARTIPLFLTTKGGGPVAVRAVPPSPEKAKEAMRGGTEPLTPQAQQYIVYIDLVLPRADDTIVPGSSAQVKIRCRDETCAHWVYRTVYDLFDLKLW